MKELDRHNVFPGSIVKMKMYDSWVMGEVTIVRENDCKVLFDSDTYDLEYTYYKYDELELVEKQ